MLKATKGSTINDRGGRGNQKKKKNSKAFLQEKINFKGPSPGKKASPRKKMLKKAFTPQIINGRPLTCVKNRFGVTFC